MVRLWFRNGSEGCDAFPNIKQKVVKEKENLIFSAAVKFGLTSERSERDAVGTETEDGMVDRVRKLEEQVVRLQFSQQW